MRSLALSVTLAVSGCSFVTVDGPPARVPPQGPIPCDSSAVVPNLVDLAAGALVGLATFGIFYAGHVDESRPDSDPGPPVVPAMFGVAAAIPFIASAIIGQRRAKRCSNMKRANPR